MKSSLYFSLAVFSFFLFKTQTTLAQNAEGQTTQELAQNAEVHITQDPQIPKLLDLKSQMIKNNELVDKYKIQILGYGKTLNDANEVLNKYKTSTVNAWQAMIVSQTPNYKVWVGHFTNRLKADRALLEIQKVFPYAFVFKPKE